MGGAFGRRSVLGCERALAAQEGARSRRWLKPAGRDFSFRAKTQRREDVALAAKRLSPLRVAVDATLKEKAALRPRTGIFASSRLRAKQISPTPARSEEHTSELQSLLRISYAVFCLKKNKNTKTNNENDYS